LRASAPVFGAREVEAIWARLRAQAATTDKREADEPRPPTAARVYWTAVASLVAALAGVLAVSYTVTGTGARWAGYLIAGAAVLIGAAARRNSLLRYPALAWMTGVVIITIILITDQLLGRPASSVRDTVKPTHAGDQVGADDSDARVATSTRARHRTSLPTTDLDLRCWRAA
jgi:hypothetical protein